MPHNTGFSADHKVGFCSWDAEQRPGFAPVPFHPKNASGYYEIAKAITPTDSIVHQ